MGAERHKLYKHAYIRTYMHSTCKKSKVKLTAAVTPPSGSTGMSSTTQTLEPSAANPPGAGLVTRRRTVQVSQIEVAEPKAPQRPHTA